MVNRDDLPGAQRVGLDDVTDLNHKSHSEPPPVSASDLKGN
jgi:hypothetical protein